MRLTLTEEVFQAVRHAPKVEARAWARDLLGGRRLERHLDRLGL